MYGHCMAKVNWVCSPNVTIILPLNKIFPIVMAVDYVWPSFLYNHFIVSILIILPKCRYVDIYSKCPPNMATRLTLYLICLHIFPILLTIVSIFPHNISFSIVSRINMAFLCGHSNDIRLYKT